MNINCKSHSSPIIYICTVQGCKAGNLICTQCLTLDPVHANQHQKFLFSTNDFLKIQNSNAYKHFLPHITQTLADCQKKIQQEVKQGQVQNKQLHQDFAYFQKIYKQLAYNAKTYLADKISSSFYQLGANKKHQGKLNQLKEGLRLLNQEKEKQSSFFGMFFTSNQEKMPQSQNDILALIKKNWNLNRVRADSLILKIELQKNTKGKIKYKKNEKSNKILEEARQKMKGQLKNIFRALKALLEDQNSDKLSSSVFSQRKSLGDSSSVNNITLQSSRKSLSKSNLNSPAPNLPTCQLPKTTLPPLPLTSNEPLLGPFLYPDGTIYYGNYRNKLKWGKGIMFYTDGSYYEGFWKEDIPDGYGRIARKDGIYQGEIKKGKADGKGWWQGKNCKYEGEWKNDKKNGQGQQFGKVGSGYQYKGFFKQNKFNGHGILINNSFNYNGHFNQGVFDGQGTVIIHHQIIYHNSEKYTGTFKNGLKQGRGVFCWPDQRRYEGEFQRDLPNGSGSFYWNDGQGYRGNWVNGQQDGMGVEISKQGGQRMGEWQKGNWVRWV